MAKLYFKYGAMGSSKSAQALITQFNYEELGMKVWLIKPSIDDRDGKNIIRSRIGLQREAQVITPEENILETFAGIPDVDVIIAGRGGGSIEDLWAFNEETVARAIFDCGTPVISAVGHETDFTIADFVADLRAPTPSAAAELAVPDMARLTGDLKERETALRAAMVRRISRERAELKTRELRLKLRSPGARLREKRNRTEELRTAIRHAINRKYTGTEQRFLRDAERLKALSPLNRLRGGFAYVTDEDGKAVRSVSDLRTGDTASLRFRDGEAKAEIRSVTILEERKTED